MNGFAKRIMESKYSHTKGDGTKESWEEIAARVAKEVMGAVPCMAAMAPAVEKLIARRVFMPGGRYLYAAGRPFHQTQNCFAGETEVVTRFGTRKIQQLAGDDSVTLMTTRGEWVEAPVRSFGVQRLMRVSLTRAGVAKEIFATAEHSWRVRFPARGRGKRAVRTADLQPGDKLCDVFGHGVSRVSLSPAGVQAGVVFGDGNCPKDRWGFGTANVRLCGHKSELLPYFAGYRDSLAGEDPIVYGLPRRYKELPDLREDRSYLFGWLAGYFAADGCVGEDGNVTLSSTRAENLRRVKDVCYVLGIGACGVRASERVSNLTGEPSTLYSVSLLRHTLTEDFFLLGEHRRRFVANTPKRSHCAWTVISVDETDREEEVFCAVVDDTHEFVLADNILTGNCLLLRAEDSREGWAGLMYKAGMALMTGAGIGVEYSRVRHKGAIIARTGGTATGPLALMKILNELGRGVMQGGSRRSAIWAGLNWQHKDILEFIHMKRWDDVTAAQKAKDFNYPAPMDGTNVSVGLDDEFFRAIHDSQHPRHAHAWLVFSEACLSMLSTGEPGFSVDAGDKADEVLRNACTEVTSADDSDICNLGSINLARVRDIAELKEITGLAVAFLLCGTVYSHVPYEGVDYVRRQNRRLGLGLMGIHEWLLQRDKRYDVDDELASWLGMWAAHSTQMAQHHAKHMSLSQPVAVRAIAPTGTIGIVAETTTGIEPIFCSAYKRRYLKGDRWFHEYVVDPVAKRLVDEGVNPDNIEDAYALAADPERRVRFQAFVQEFVDHGISSTLNLPRWGSKHNNAELVPAFSTMLLKYLPRLRGLTCYPDGARGGQPLTAVPFREALLRAGSVYVEQADVCDITRGGTCGD